MKTELFIYKMMNLYKDHEPTLEGMIEAREVGTSHEFCVDDKKLNGGGLFLNYMIIIKNLKKQMRRLRAHFM